MLKAPVPTTKRRLAGALCLLALVFACGYAAWATQPSAVAADIPSDSIRVRVAMQIDDGDAKEKSVVVRLGEPITLMQSVNGHVWTLNATVARGTGPQHGLLMFNASVLKDGAVVQSPRVAMQNGAPGAIQIGTDNSAIDGKFEGIRLDVTLTESSQVAAATPAAGVAANTQAAPKAESRPKSEAARM